MTTYTSGNCYNDKILCDQGFVSFDKCKEIYAHPEKVKKSFQIVCSGDKAIFYRYNNLICNGTNKAKIDIPLNKCSVGVSFF